MIHNVVMPHLGLTMEEGSVASWNKNLGDRVEKGEVLFTVETDKAEMEVESTESGYLSSIQVKIGEKVPIGTLIATLGDEPGEVREEGQSDEASPSRSQLEVCPEPRSHGGNSATTTSATVRSTAASIGDKFPASPRARRLARELGIDITKVKPSRGTRVIEDDIRRFQASLEAARATTNPPIISSRTLTTRKIVAQRMTVSFHTAPHFYLGVEANAADLVRFRDRLLDPCQKRAGVRLTYTDLFLRALALGLKEHPQVNAFWHKDGIQVQSSVDIGFAAQTNEGLVVPVIRKADGLDLFELARQRQLLTNKAKTGKLSLTEMEGGSATLSNLGSSGVDWFQAILNPPQSVILATGRIAKRVIVLNDRLEIHPTVVLSLSVDHRVLDGVAGANFLCGIRNLIENPSIMLL